MKNLTKWTMLGAAAVALAACTGGQPSPPCAVGHGGFGAHFTKLTGPTTGACVRPGDMIGVQKYRQTDGSQDVYLRSEWLSEDNYFNVQPLGNDPSVPLSSGKLSDAHPDANNFCTVPTLTAATGTDPNGNTLTYTFSNVKFYMTGAVPGTQFTADLSIDDGAGCLATYTVDAAYPIVFCMDDNAVQDDTICTGDQVSDAWYSGATMNPLFATTCQPTRDASDPDSLIGAGNPENPLCVPGTIPSLR